MRKVIVYFLFIIFLACNSENKKTEYFSNGNYKEIIFKSSDSLIIRYFKNDGTLEAEGYKKDEIENLTFFHNNGNIEKGEFLNGKRRGWHSIYNKEGKIVNRIFYMDDKIYQGKIYNKDGTIDMKNSVYVDIHLPIDTLPQNKEVPGYIRYFNTKSKYEYLRVYLNLNNEATSNFSNIYSIDVDTFGTEFNEQEVYFLVKFPKKGKNYIRGYLFDGVQDSLHLDEFKGINVLFEKEVFVN